MKRLKWVSAVVLIMVLGFSGCSQEQNNTRETADDLLGKVFEYLVKEDIENALSYLFKAVELDPKKNVYNVIVKYAINGKYSEALKLLDQRKAHSPGENEGKVIQIMEAKIHFQWAKDLEKKYSYLEAVSHYEAAYVINIVYMPGNAAIDLNNIGTIYDNLDQKLEALQYYKKALPIFREVGDQSGESATLSNIGLVYDDLGQKQKALEYYENVLPLRRELGDRSGEASTLNNIGGIYDALGQEQKALEYYEKVLPILQEIGDKENEAGVLSNLMFTWKEMNESSLAIFYGKQSVNCYQQLRRHISGLEKDIKTTYLKSREDTYRYLASLLVSAGRLPEAQYILDMLKGEEYFAYIRRDRDANSRVYAPIDFTSLEKNLTIGRKAYAQYLAGLKEAFFSYDEKSKGVQPETQVMIEHAAALQTTLRSLDQGEGVRTAAVHYLVTGNTVIAILTTPHNQTSFESPVESEELNIMIQDYRLTLLEENPDQRGVRLKLKPGPSGAGSLTRLYEIIFQQVDEQLKNYGATNLIVYLDGVLRYLPLPALWDGQTFLVQRYRMAVFTVSSLDRIKDIPTYLNPDQMQILGMGASKGSPDFPALPQVKEEIRAIVNDQAKGFRGLIKGKALRLAQLQMAGLPDLLGKDKDKQSPDSPNNTRADFRDAYRWGPFIMIGNWR